MLGFGVVVRWDDRPMDYSDRFEASNYDDDPVVGVYLDDPDDGAVFSERLFLRMVSIGKAYELHLLPLLGGPDPVTLNSTQLETLAAELQLVREVSRDGLLLETVSRFEGAVEKARRMKAVLTIEGE
jgi:hypothetical protein